MNRFPLALTALRLILGPVVIFNALRGANPWVFLVCLVGAFVSDILDGILARRLGVATDGLRQLDSMTDVVFYACVFVAIWLVDPGLVRADAVALSLLGGLEMGGQLLGLALRGKPMAVHSYLAKFWGVCLFLASCEVLVGGAGGVWFGVMLGVGFVMYAEWYAIVLMTRGRAVDVGSVVCLLRRGGSAECAAYGGGSGAARRAIGT
jgi:CDP-diacylglycerol--glycerol-3-phosphate 3-phosphatidyltransferase